MTRAKSLCPRPWSALSGAEHRGHRRRRARPSQRTRARQTRGLTGLTTVTDGIFTLRPSEQDDRGALIAGRDDAFHRWLGPGSEDPRPTACILVAGEVVGWVDYDAEPEWLEPGAVNVGYNVFPLFRGRGYASRAVQLMMHHLAVRTDHRTAVLVIDADNLPSLALASRLGFQLVRDDKGQLQFTRPVPPVMYTDGVVTIRPPRTEDLDADLDAKDNEQMDRLWLPGEREQWQAMSRDQQRAHALRGLVERRDLFGVGPKWTFSVDAPDADYVAYIDCDLANELVPDGEANIAYSAHPAHRGKGYVTRAVRLLIEFLRDHTGARVFHIIVDTDNVPSLRVAEASGARSAETWLDDQGRTMVRYTGSARSRQWRSAVSDSAPTSGEAEGAPSDVA